MKNSNVKTALAYANNKLVSLVADYDEGGKLLSKPQVMPADTTIAIPVKAGKDLWVMFSNENANIREMKRMTLFEMTEAYADAVIGISIGAMPEEIEPCDATMALALTM